MKNPKFIEFEEDGTKYWYLNNKLHRIDGPAYEDINGTKAWYLNGILHRNNGPAIEYSNGFKQWWLYGKLHREDGPAVEYPSGHKYWYLNGEELTEEKWQAKVFKVSFDDVFPLLSRKVPHKKTKKE